MSEQSDTLIARLRRWLAGLAFTLAGILDPIYDVWLDDAPRCKPVPGEPDECTATVYMLGQPMLCGEPHHAPFHIDLTLTAGHQFERLAGGAR